jgi:phospholipid/cholesterol/gamma-HCH transport system substrate-binding protein
MMITTREKATVGAFVVAITALTLGVLVALWGVNAAKPHRDYFILFDESVAGLVKGSPVKYEGVDIGRVSDIRIDETSPGRVRVDIEIEQRHGPVMLDTKAQLVGQGLTGMRYLDLTRAHDSKETRDRPASTPIPALPSAWTDAIERLTKISEAVTKLLDDENRAEISRALKNVNAFLEAGTATVLSSQATLEHLTGKIDRMIDEGKISSAIEDLAGSAKDARKTIASIEETVREVRANVQQANLPATIADIRSDMNGTAGAVRALTPRLEDDLERTSRLLEMLRRTTHDVDELARQLRARPSLILRDYEQKRREIPDKE